LAGHVHFPLVVRLKSRNCFGGCQINETGLYTHAFPHCSVRLTMKRWATPEMTI
jgi:hypothetical protein